jgi:simple sugar transport system ATP-binding protein
MKAYNIKARIPETQVGNMSGGNQQKVVIAREVERDHELLIACHPTHGLDIGAIEFIHQKIMEERNKQKGVLLVSTELEELLSLSDRILVMYKGEIMGEVEARLENLSSIGSMMLGGCHGKA